MTAGGGPIVPIAGAAALSELGTDEDQTAQNDEPGEADDDLDSITAPRRGEQTDDGVPVGSADAEQDRVRASSEQTEDE